MEASKAGNGRSLSVSLLLFGPCADLITYKHAALAGLLSPSVISFPLDTLGPALLVSLAAQASS